MTRLSTIVFLACILAVPLFSSGSAPLPGRSLKMLRLSALGHSSRRSAPRPRRPSAPEKALISKDHIRDDEPLLVILYDVRPGSWM